MPAKNKSVDGKSQHERFIETARALECDEDKERFEEKLRRIATAKPKEITKDKSSQKPKTRKRNVS
jgi:hypothetical protein